MSLVKDQEMMDENGGTGGGGGLGGGGGGDKNFDFMELFRSTLEELEDEKTRGSLETVYQCMVERENDFRVAAEIGQMLVERNRQLMEDLSNVETDWQYKV